jgi:hypothetical protein
MDTIRPEKRCANDMPEWKNQRITLKNGLESRPCAIKSHTCIAFCLQVLRGIDVY